MKDLKEKVRQGFMELSSRLSPENLTGDGELSQRQVNLRIGHITREWKALEKKAGRHVGRDEVEDFVVECIRKGLKA